MAPPPADEVWPDGSAARLARLMAARLGTAVAITATRPLAGGAVRRHWHIAATLGDGAPLECVLRSDGATRLGLGLALGDELALLRCLHAAGLAVPAPLLCCADPAVIGRPFHLTRFVRGSAEPAALVAAGPHDALAEALARELAALQRIVPPRPALAFLGPRPADSAQARLDAHRARLDALDEARPAAEWAMRWLARHRPAAAAAVLCHGDFRTGNYLVADGRLAALLDWEFAHWGDPDEDIAWFCSRCWRFGADRFEAGGIAPLAVFRRAYETASGRCLDPGRLRWWETMAALKWLVIALLQRDRFLVGGERSLDLALTGRRVAECELELLRLTGEGADARSA